MNSTAVPSDPCADDIVTPLRPHASQKEESRADEKSSYGQILKSSALIGGSSVVNILIGIVRTKAMALLLGPEGFGLMGVYGSISNFARALPVWASTVVGCARLPKQSGRGTAERIAQDGHRAAPNFHCAWNIGRCSAGHLFATGIRPDLWGRSTRYPGRTLVSRGVFQLSSRRAGCIDSRECGVSLTSR